MPPRLHRITGVRLYFIPIRTRVPLKFGSETLTSVTCARVALRVADAQGNQAEGWGETPLSVQWVWPSPLPYEPRHSALKSFCERLAGAWLGFEQAGHPLELGHHFQEHILPGLPGHERYSGAPLPAATSSTRSEASVPPPLPWLAALVCNSAFDIALHDAYGRLAGRPIYQTYGPEFLSQDLGRFLEPAGDASVSFRGRYPADYLSAEPAQSLRAWHLVGGLDLLDHGELTGTEPNDGHPVVLTDWIERDGLKCLKVKLRGNDDAWDYDRLVRVGQIASEQKVEWLSADFNCTVREPVYVNEILDRLRAEQPRIYDRILYVEQPFSYDLEANRIEVHSVSARKPLFLDESAHDWRMVRLGRELGWTGVALKTCKTQTGAILSACWAKAHGLNLMVQDLTNPMLAQIPHVLLAAHVGTIMGVETNAMQFYPAASAPEEKVHPGLYQRRQGSVDLSTIRGPGFGYQLEQIHRELPRPAIDLEAR
ncbi:MAG TPA: enolase C-terminal domain-like protein [Candidatus Binatia bacterium]|jgi:L-alanine-DL-glutamate epimerase-like enolase superfamily enzyme|nr:enolase C-terminal domain-like protein [Candidatus Binatia bacterium]